MRTHHKLPLLGALCAVAFTAVVGCDDEPIPLFDEQGTWALVLFDIDGTGLTKFDVGMREEKFMIHFDSETGIVASAGCVDSMGRTDITTTLCDQPNFQCRCFNYTYAETAMTWTEFKPEGGELPPPPPEDSDAAKPGEPVAIQLSVYADSGQTYNYSTLPYGLFNSDGKTTKYVFQTRGDSDFLATGCMEACGIPVAAPEGEAAGN